MLRMSTRLWTAWALAAAVATVCVGQGARKKGSSKVEQNSYGKMPDGTPIEMYTLSNANGMRAEIINYGGIVVSLTAPDKAGKYDHREDVRNDLDVFHANMRDDALHLN